MMGGPLERELDPQLAAIVAAMRASRAPPPFSGTPQEARSRMQRAVMAARARSPLPAVASVEDVLADHGGSHVPVRVYRPMTNGAGTAAGNATIVFFHGGGFVLGSVELADDVARKLCRDVGAVVVSVDYRLAPENPFPAAHDDALVACRWASREASSLGGDAARVVIAGESAGANLAASSALTLSMEGIALAAQLLVVPGLDVARDTSLIDASLQNAPMLTTADLRDISRLYMGARPELAEGFSPSPLRAPRLHGLPPTVIAVAGHDPLQSEGLRYAERLRDGGVHVDVLRFDDMFHPFLAFFEASTSARAANDEICRALRAVLQPSAPS
ncbi:alpha/beta hydrolase [soil metagenome]